MGKKWTITGSVVAVIAIAVLIIVFWPTDDPLAGVEKVAIQSPNWGEEPQGEIIQGPFIDGLEVTLGEKNITIVGTDAEADAILAIKEIEVGRIEVLIQEGSIRGRVTAVCTLVDLQTGKERVMDFHLTLEDGTVEADLVARKFWQVWK